MADEIVDPEPEDLDEFEGLHVISCGTAALGGAHSRVWRTAEGGGATLLVALNHDNLPVGQADDGVRAAHDPLVVGDDDQRPSAGRQVVEDGEDLLAGLGVEVPGGLVGEDDQGIVGEGPAMATRCCSPPESSIGRCRARGPRPTRSASSWLRRCRSRRGRPR